jgi:hypothetical protein
MRIDRVIASLVAIVGVGLLSAASLLAHHAFAAEFDSNRPVKLKGTIAKVEWINPHAWIHIDVKNEEGQVERWMLELGGPGPLTRRGIGRNHLKVGTEISAEGYLAKGVKHRANARLLQYDNGQELFVGSSGTGAPADGRDPTER